MSIEWTEAWKSADDEGRKEIVTDLEQRLDFVERLLVFFVESHCMEDFKCRCKGCKRAERYLKLNFKRLYVQP